MTNLRIKTQLRETPKNLVRFNCTDQDNYRKLAEEILLALGDGKLVQIPHIFWQASSSTLRRHIFNLKPKLDLLFPNRANINSETVLERGENFAILSWRLKTEKRKILTVQRPCEILVDDPVEVVSLKDEKEI